VLLNRLDRPVSGLLLAGLDADARQAYALWQDQGQVRKFYLAVVHGQVNEACEVRAALDTANRRKVRLLPGQEPDPLRWTAITPLVRQVDMNQTLVQVEIRKGRRHQIRAHLACLGLPIVGDGLYGNGPEQEWIFLHHFQLNCPGLSAHCLPQGPQWDFWTRQAEDVLAAHFQPSGADSAKEP
jgi:23S rRNA pseudouridine1911/1915/1917 synthase